MHGHRLAGLFGWVCVLALAACEKETRPPVVTPAADATAERSGPVAPRDNGPTPESIAAAYPVGGSEGCSVGDLETAAKILQDMPEEDRAGPAAVAIKMACDAALTDLQQKYLRIVQASIRLGPEERAAEIELGLAEEVCPSLGALRASTRKLAPAEAARAVFNGCDLAKYGVVGVEDVDAFYGADPRAHSFFPWLAEHGVPGPVAAELVRGLLVFETYGDGLAGLGFHGRLPVVAKAGAVPRCPVIQVSTEAVDFRRAHIAWVRPDSGSVDPEPRGGLIPVLYEALFPVRAAEDKETRLAALIPPPNFHMVRYHGVLAAHAKARIEVVPGPEPEPAEPTQLRLVFDGEPMLPEHTTTRSSRHPWASLLQRVFAVDVMVCPRPRCRGAMKLVKIATRPDAIAGVLAKVGLGPRPPPRPRPALPGQLELDLSA